MPSSPPLPTRPRNVAIDTLRGLACLLLVGYHVIGASELNGLRLPDDDLLRRINDGLSFLRMPLFAFLSGVVYASRPPSLRPGRLIAGKARRLLVPMLLVGTAFAVLQANVVGTHAPARDWMLLHIVPVAHYWFLESLFLIFVGLALLEQQRALLTPARLAVVGAMALMVHLFVPLPVYLGLQGAAYLLPSFLLGLGARRFVGSPGTELEFAL